MHTGGCGMARRAVCLVVYIQYIYRIDWEIFVVKSFVNHYQGQKWNKRNIFSDEYIIRYKLK